MCVRLSLRSHNSEIPLWTAAATKIWHALGGLYLWELLTTFDHEWSVIRGRRPYRWTILLYSFIRVTTLVAIILAIVTLDAMSQYNCQVTTIFRLVMCDLSLAASQLLIILRVVAIWDRKKVVTWAAIGLWVINLACLIQGVVMARSVWVPSDAACVTSNIRSFEIALMGTLTTDLILLFISLLGLFRLRRGGGGRFGISQLLWTQGVVWFILGVITEISLGVPIILDMSYSGNIMFQPPSAIVMSITATRMYRALADFAFGSTDSCQRSGLPVSKLGLTPAVQIIIDRMEVADVHMASRSSRDDKLNE
ncbi:hypothetical protein BJV74DRAFT_549047 [Russula compacta]|nr:hypothetical protein BJV74DRAFT_549047 [Russula compacta]